MPSQKVLFASSRQYDRWAVASLVLQLCLVLYVFRTLLFHPGDYLIVNHYDGIKGYFSIESFLRQPLGEGMLAHGFNYPFGEYMYYTDTTPLLVQAIHVLVRAVPALQPYGLYFYDLGILSGLWLSTWLLTRLLKPLHLPGWLLLVACIGLPWLAPQTSRLRVGHMSLSYTPAVLYLLWTLQQLYYSWPHPRLVRKWLLRLLLGLVVAAYLHFYYLGILGALTGFFFLFWVIEAALAHRPWFGIAWRGAVLLLLAAGLTLGSLMLLDSRYHERPTSSGYGYIDWKLQPAAFFQAPSHNKLHFLFERKQLVPYESNAYLGGFVLYAGVVALLLLVLRRRSGIPAVEEPNGHFLRLLLLASIPVMFIALGETYELDNDTYVFYNYLNPFYWLHLVTDRVTQFRALGRFVWPFWWAAALGTVWVVGRWWTRPVWAPLRWAVVPLVLILLLDTRDAGRFYRHYTQMDNILTPPANTREMQNLLASIDSKSYQAILPVPFYHVGSEGSYEYTIDPDDPHCNHTFQAGLLTNLPLMSHKAGRTPPYQAQQLMSIFRPGGPDPALLSQLDSRPILVFLDSAYYNGSNNYYRDNLRERPQMLEVFERGDDFIREQSLQLLRKEGTLALYAWYPRRKAAAYHQ